MPLVKCNDGMIEGENFYLASSVDFLGNNMECYVMDNYFVLSKGSIERSLLHNTFVIEVKKKYNTTSSKDAAFFYISNGEKFGILEKYSTEQKDYCYWKIIYYDNFIQTYKSLDGQLWENIGGVKVDNISLQGFEVTGKTPFMFSDYKLYKTPYITIYDYPNNYKMQLIDTSNDIIKQGTFYNNECKIFLDYCFKGKIRILDANNNLVSSTDLIDLHYGDEFYLSDYNIELYYGKNKVKDTTLIKTPLEILTIKNVSDTSYRNLNINITKPDNNYDIIGLSLDATDFNTSINIEELRSNESKDIYIKIESTNKSANILHKNFNLNIGGAL